MSELFWGTALLMLAASVCVVALPLKPLATRSRKLFATVVLSLPLASLGLYALLGTPAAVRASPPAQRSDQPASPHKGMEHEVGSVASLLDGLRERLEREPDDAGGWLLLAKSYRYLDRMEEARAAYARAKALGKTDAELEASLGAPDAADGNRGEAAGPAIPGTVLAAPDVAGHIRLTDTVFVFGKRSADDRMPVVALRRSAADLPFDFVLTDRNLMRPGTHLADYDSLVVTARVSRSSNATDNSMGLESGGITASTAHGEPIRLVIGQSTEPKSEDHE